MYVKLKLINGKEFELSLVEVRQIAVHRYGLTCLLVVFFLIQVIDVYHYLEVFGQFSKSLFVLTLILSVTLVYILLINFWSHIRTKTTNNPVRVISSIPLSIAIVSATLVSFLVVNIFFNFEIDEFYFISILCFNLMIGEMFATAFFSYFLDRMLLDLRSIKIDASDHEGMTEIFENHTSGIKYISSEGVYVRIHTKDKNYLERSSLKDISVTLHNQGVRTHRSFWVAYSSIKGLEAVGKTSTVILKDGTKIPVSKNYLEHVRSSIRNNSKFKRAAP